MSLSKNNEEHTPHTTYTPIAALSQIAGVLTAAARVEACIQYVLVHGVHIICMYILVYIYEYDEKSITYLRTV